MNIVVENHLYLKWKSQTVSNSIRKHRICRRRSQILQITPSLQLSSDVYPVDFIITQTTRMKEPKSVAEISTPYKPSVTHKRAYSRKSNDHTPSCVYTREANTTLRRRLQNWRCVSFCSQISVVSRLPSGWVLKYDQLISRLRVRQSHRAITGTLKHTYNPSSNRGLRFHLCRGWGRKALAT